MWRRRLVFGLFLWHEIFCGMFFYVLATQRQTHSLERLANIRVYICMLFSFYLRYSITVDFFPFHFRNKSYFVDIRVSLFLGIKFGVSHVFFSLVAAAKKELIHFVIEHFYEFFFLLVDLLFDFFFFNFTKENKKSIHSAFVE